MDTDSINNFVAETFSKVVVRKQTLLKKISWKDQLEAAVNAIPYIGGSPDFVNAPPKFNFAC